MQYSSQVLLQHCRKDHMHCFICGVNNPSLVGLGVFDEV